MKENKQILAPLFAIEARRDKQQAAYQIIEMFLKGEADKISRAQIEQAGGTAIANRIFFAVAQKPGSTGLLARFVPRKKTQCHDKISPIISTLLPPAPDGKPRAEEGTLFHFDEMKDMVALAKELASRGFVWKRSFQEDFANGIAATLERTLLPHRVKERPKA